MNIRERFTRRHLLGGVGAVSLGGVMLGACGQPAAMAPSDETAKEEMPKEETKKPAMAEPVDVHWLTNHNSRQADNVDTLVKEPFEADNPGITLNWIIWSGDRRQFLLTLVAGGQAPDVSWLTDPALTALGAVEAIDDRVAKDQIDLSPFPKTAMDAWFRRDGKLFALPNQSGGNWPIAPINKRMYEEAGLNLPPNNWEDPDWTFDRFTAEMKLLTKEEGGKTVQFGMVGANANYLFLNWPALFDAEWLADDNRTVISEDPALVDAYERYFTMVHEDRSVDKPGQVQELFGTNSRTAFVEEKGAMLRSAPGGFFPVLEAIQRGAPFVFSPVAYAARARGRSRTSTWTATASSSAPSNPMPAGNCSNGVAAPSIGRSRAARASTVLISSTNGRRTSTAIRTSRASCAWRSTAMPCSTECRTDGSSALLPSVRFARISPTRPLRTFSQAR